MTEPREPDLADSIIALLGLIVFVAVMAAPWTTAWAVYTKLVANAAFCALTAVFIMGIRRRWH